MRPSNDVPFDLNTDNGSDLGGDSQATATRSPTEQLAAWVERLGQRLAQRDIDGTLELFADDCHWRDLVLFSWNLVTLAAVPSPKLRTWCAC